MLRSWISILGSPFHLEEPQAREISVGEVCTSLAEGRCGQHAAAAPTFLIWPVLVGLVQECFSPSLVFQDSLGSGVLFMNSC